MLTCVLIYRNLIAHLCTHSLGIETPGNHLRHSSELFMSVAQTDSPIWLQNKISGLHVHAGYLGVTGHVWLLTGELEGHGPLPPGPGMWPDRPQPVAASIICWPFIDASRSPYAIAAVISIVSQVHFSTSF